MIIITALVTVALSLAISDAFGQSIFEGTVSVVAVITCILVASDFIGKLIYISWKSAEAFRKPVFVIGSLILLPLLPIFTIYDVLESNNLMHSSIRDTLISSSLKVSLVFFIIYCLSIACIIRSVYIKVSVGENYKYGIFSTVANIKTPQASPAVRDNNDEITVNINVYSRDTSADSGTPPGGGGAPPPPPSGEGRSQGESNGRTAFLQNNKYMYITILAILILLIHGSMISYNPFILALFVLLLILRGAYVINKRRGRDVCVFVALVYIATWISWSYPNGDVLSVQLDKLVCKTLSQDHCEPAKDAANQQASSGSANSTAGNAKANTEAQTNKPAPPEKLSAAAEQSAMQELRKVWFPTFVSFIVVLIYGVYAFTSSGLKLEGFRDATSNSSFSLQVDEIGDDMYMMGFLLTLVGMMTALQGFDSTAMNIKETAGRCGGAISSTFAAITGRFILRHLKNSD